MTSRVFDGHSKGSNACTVHQGVMGDQAALMTSHNMGNIRVRHIQIKHPGWVSKNHNKKYICGGNLGRTSTYSVSVTGILRQARGQEEKKCL